MGINYATMLLALTLVDPARVAWSVPAALVMNPFIVRNHRPERYAVFRCCTAALIGASQTHPGRSARPSADRPTGPRTRIFQQCPCNHPAGDFDRRGKQRMHKAAASLWHQADFGRIAPMPPCPRCLSGCRTNTAWGSTGQRVLRR